MFGFWPILSTEFYHCFRIKEIWQESPIKSHNFPPDDSGSPDVCAKYHMSVMEQIYSLENKQTEEEMLKKTVFSQIQHQTQATTMSDI